MVQIGCIQTDFICVHKANNMKTVIAPIHISDEVLTSFSFVEFDRKEIDHALLLTEKRVYSDHDLLLLLSALNLLNAAIKTKEYKKQLSYRIIKGHATRVLCYLIKSDPKNLNARYWLNRAENCAYIEVGNVQFSFHQIPKNDIINNFCDSNKNVICNWRGIRLQHIAVPLFRYVNELK